MEAFYQIEETQVTENHVQVSVEVNPEHPIYKAHFPGQPITPGAMHLRMAIEIVSAHCGLPSDAKEVRNVKFLTPHYPLQQSHLTFLFDAESRPVEVTIRQEEVTYAKMTLVF